MQFHLTTKSSNKKLGGLPASTSSSDTCPLSCGLYNQCYAKRGPQSWHWAKVTKQERGTDWPSFLSQVEKLKPGSLFRHNVSGDLPTLNSCNALDQAKLFSLMKATETAGVSLYTYTHWWTDDDFGRANLNIVKRFSRPGFVINVSTEDVEIAVLFKRYGLDVVLTNTDVFDMAVHGIKNGCSSLEIVNSSDLDNPVKVIPCPEQYTDTATCASCKLCSRANRNYVIAFKEH